MIKIKQQELTIIIPGPGPENWKEIVSDLLDLLYCQDQNFVNKHQSVFFLLQHMMPASEQISIRT